MKTKSLQISVPSLAMSVSAIFDCPRDACLILVLAHGAGADMNHSFMSTLAKGLNDRSIATLRFQFCYMEKGHKRPDRPPAAIATIEAAFNAAVKLKPQLPIFAGGKSFGGRMTTNAVSEKKLPGVRGLICFGFPLHPAKKAGISRADHFERLDVPVLFVQGTRDALCDLVLFRKVLSKLPPDFELATIEEADHSFSVRKKSGRDDSDVMSEITDATRDFCSKLI
jgi:predicted alpha/beta-hydrolase family hydrolase